MVKIYKIFVNIILVLLIIILGCYAILRFANKVEIYNVKTGSMEDDIHVGDYVLIYKKGIYDVGDVVTYHRDDYFITHRIIKKDGNRIITKGDANNTIDEEIDSSDIIGKVIISGGILNIVVTYKLAIVAVFVALYLISCYFGEKEELNEEDFHFDDDEKEEELEEQDGEKKEEEEENIDTPEIEEKKVSRKKKKQ